MTPWPGSRPEAVAGNQPIGHHPLVDGAQLHPAPPHGRDGPRAPARVVVTTGPDSCRWTDLRPGTEITVGRDPAADLRLADPMVSRQHAVIATGRGGVTVVDAGSTNGTWLDDLPVTGPVPWRPGSTVRVGGSRLVLTETDPDRPAPRQRTVVQQPRAPDVPLPTAELRTPDRSLPPPPGGTPVLVWVIPLLVSGALAAVLRMPYLLLFGLMAPAMSLGTHVSERRRHRRETRRAEEVHRAGVERTLEDAQHALETERAARERRAPAAGPLVSRLLAGDLTAVWTRSTEDGIRVRVGLGDLLSRVVVDGSALPLPAAPVELDLRHGVTIRGPVDAVRALSRHLLLQVLLHHPPGDLGLDVPEGPARGPAWEWVMWAPHHGVAAHTTLRLRESVAEPDAEVRIGSSRAEREPTRLLVDGGGGLTITRPGAEDTTCTADLVADDVVLAVARCLTSVRWLGTDTGPAPSPPSFRDLHPPADPAALTALWRRSPRSTRFTLGSAADGPVTFDLAVDGPHVLVGGTTGSGKSELLRSLVTSLATANRPDELGFVLVDYKGGSAFGDCALLPHTRAVVTDLDPHLADRALRSLTAELKRRERVLAGAGARDLASYQLAGGTDLPRLVLVIDEFRALAQELPAFLEGLVRLAALGRSLGVHVVLATQRPAGIVSADIRANVNLRISLRVRDESDSRDVLDTADAARLPEREPGHALVRTGAEPPRALRVAAVSEPDRRGTDPTVRWIDSPWDADDPGDAGADEASPGGGSGTYLQELAAAAREAARALGCREVPPPWLPPLPDVLTVAELPDGPGDPSSVPPGVPVGLLDLPDAQEQTTLHWAPVEDGNLLVVGAPRSGRSTTARTVVAGLIRSPGPVPHLYGFDPAGALAPLAGLPTTGAWVGADETARGARVVEVLTEVVERRRRDLAAGGWASLAEQHRSPAEPMPLVLVVVDDWAAFTATYADVDRGRVVERLVQVLREGPTVGVVSLVTGDRSLLTSRLTAAAGRTWCLPMADPHDLLLTGLRPAQVPDRMPPGRLVRVADGGVAQVAVISATPDGGSQLVELADLVGSVADAAGRGSAGIRRVRPLPARVDVASLPSRCPDLVLGVGGDDAEPCGLPLQGGLWLVAGPPSSGRTTTLATIARQARLLGWKVVDLAADTALPDGPEPACVLVDDVTNLLDTPLEDRLVAWAQTAPDRGSLLVVAGDSERLASTFRGIVPVVTRNRTGLLLQPRGAADGAVLGVDVAVPDAPLPGRGLLVERGRVLARVQVAVPEG